MILLAWIAWTVFAIMTVEHLLHRYPMHQPGWPLAHDTFRRHAFLHHYHGRTDINIDLPVLYGLTVASPLWLGLMSIGLYAPALILVVGVTIQCVLWTGLHRAFHEVGGAWTKRLPFYARWERHHLDHHAHPGRNFGTTFGPLSDYLFGTEYRGTRKPLTRRSAPPN